MSHSSTRGSASSTAFGKRKEPHTIIIAHGNDIKHFTVKPWMALTGGAFCAAMAFGYLVATSYLVLRDDLIGATVSRQARLQHAYEDRISALRTQVDRITSRQLLDQQLMESKVVELIERQDQLSSRDGELGSVLKKAKASLGSISAPKPKTDDQSASAIDSMATGSIAASIFSAADAATGNETAADRADHLFTAINRSLREIDNSQIKQVRNLAQSAKQNTDKIEKALAVAGYEPKEAPDTAEGGPFISADSVEAAEGFKAEVKILDIALDHLDNAKAVTLSYPVATPIPGAEITSLYGTRRDPLLGTAAFHSGMDFRGTTGTPILAAASGKVLNAGNRGGYGNEVELDHGNGLTTRYGHMSQIYVREGEKIHAGQVIGAVGSTGRSTGPHLHYEVRKDGVALDPAPFIRAGRKIEDLL